VLALDVGELGVIPENAPADLAATISTVVDLRGSNPEVVRVGAVGVAELRAVCPDLVDSTVV
jgi:tRNA A37 threonylcarbamoyladenosine synthetase subunit TsaC/SUA5/YrdC